VTAVVIGLRGGAAYARGLWDRLNGGGRRVERSGMPFGLPAPRAAREQRAASTGALLRDIDALEQRVQEASKARPWAVPPAAAGGRACAEPGRGRHAPACPMRRRVKEACTGVAGVSAGRAGRTRASYTTFYTGPGSPPRCCAASSTCGAPRVLSTDAHWQRAQVREARVRKAGIGGRARLAGELREMDAEARPQRRPAPAAPAGRPCLRGRRDAAS
jgi:hypothetical protein